DRLVRLFERNSPSSSWNLSTVDFEAVRAGQQSFSAFGAVSRTDAELSGTGSAERVTVGRVTSGFFLALGVRVPVGRGIEAADDGAGAPRVAVLSHEAARRFGPEPRAALGRSIGLDGVGHTVIGVLPSGVDQLAGFRAAIWTGLEIRPPTRRGPFWMQGIARLAPGATLASATADLDRISRAIFPVWQSSFQDAAARITPVGLEATIVRDAPSRVALFVGAVALLLLIAIANVATLLLVRTHARAVELSVRTAIGAGRRRLARLVLVECLVLGGAAGLLGVGIARLGIAFAPAMLPDLPRIDTVHFGARTALFATAAWLASAMLVALSPVATVLSGALTRSELATAGRRGSTGRSAARGALVVAEFALAVPLAVGAGLLLRSYLGLGAVDPGFDAQGVAAVRVSLPAARYPNREAVAAFWRQAEARAGALPGSTVAGLATALPPDEGENAINNFDLRDKPVPQGASQPTAPWIAVTSGSFAALRVPLLEGRLFTEADSAGAPAVVVVSRTWADRYFPGERALGREFFEGGCTTCPPTTVVGVVGDVKYLGLDREADAVYLPMAQATPPSGYLLVRGTDAGAAARDIRELLAGLDPALPTTVSVLSDRLDTELADPLRRTGLVGGFAAIALLLAAIGVFGLVSYAVRRERRELGVRIALGADPASVRLLVIRRGMRLAGAGIAIGLGLTAVESRWLASQLYGIGPTDPGTIVAALLALGLAALIGCWLPAARAARIHPLEAIGSD
ncbi:MAG: ABC transporter permease, partial [Gemmatimonadales bacterium]